MHCCDLFSLSLHSHLELSVGLGPVLLTASPAPCSVSVSKRLLKEASEDVKPMEPWVPGGVQADRGIWETEGPWEPGLTFPTPSPVEASQQAAGCGCSLSGWRTMNSSGGGRPAAGPGHEATASTPGRCVGRMRGFLLLSQPLEPMSLLPAPTQGFSLEASLLCQSQSWRRHQGASRPVPLSQSRTEPKRETQGVPRKQAT